MRGKRTWKLFALSIALLLVAAACGGDGGDEGGTGGLTGATKKGGVYRVGTDAFEWNASLDPSGEYLGTAWAIYTNLLHRALLGYNLTAGPEGNEIVPDLATEVPEAEDNGTTYTFTLKEGIEFGPPLDRVVTSKDIAYAFERIATPSVVAQYGFYYTPYIEGMQEFADGKADSISGIETPDDQTIVFHLNQQVSDFLYRMTMPATAPIPEEVAKCWTKAGEYGRYQIATGPYMLRGSEDLDISSCDAMKPIEGFDPNKFVLLDRNPNYDQSTDDVRKNYINQWELTLDTNTQDIFDKIEAGELEGEVAAPPPQVLRRYSTDSSLKPHLHAEQGDRTWYLTMNLTQPPFNDIHVRKAMNLIMDKDAIHRAWGGEIRGSIHGHIMPDLMLDGTLDDYDPYGSPDQTGDLEAAKKEMALSKYDSDGDGVCDDPVCKNLLHVTRTTPPWTEMEAPIEDSAAKIGIELTTRAFEDSYTVIQTMSRNVPFASNAGWGKDYNSPVTFAVLFDSASILPTGNINYSLIGLDQALLDDLAKTARESEPPVDFDFTGSLDDVPNVDQAIKDCVATAPEDAVECWGNFDKMLMEDVVPWVPYLDATNVDITGPAVTNYDYDQFSGEAAWSKVAVDESKQNGL